MISDDDVDRYVDLPSVQKVQRLAVQIERLRSEIGEARRSARRAMNRRGMRDRVSAAQVLACAESREVLSSIKNEMQAEEVSAAAPSPTELAGLPPEARPGIVKAAEALGCSESFLVDAIAPWLPPLGGAG